MAEWLPGIYPPRCPVTTDSAAPYILPSALGLVSDTATWLQPEPPAEPVEETTKGPDPALPAASLPWWMDGETLPAAVAEPAFLAKGLRAFWNKVRGWLLLPLEQQDPLTCSEALLALLAWDRDIERFSGEPLELFRKRVKYAYLNAVDAGSAAGFVRIFERLGITITELRERQPGIDWDVITIVLEDEELASNWRLLLALVTQYGRTCRRYAFLVNHRNNITLRHGHFSLSTQVIRASM